MDNTSSSPTGSMTLLTAICWVFSQCDIDALVLTPLMHIVTICVGIATLYYYIKPKDKK